MSAQKLLVCLAIALIAVIATEVASISSYDNIDNYASNRSNKSHHLIVGSRVPGDRLVLRQSVIEKSSWMQVISITRRFNTTRTWEKITQVRALDQKTNGNGAYASLLSGGPGFNNVTLKFKSQRGHGINFIVELYAR
ncbi:putative salivary secreted peptide [Lasioglossum baleicum]|uniref:putative salivary secreted peptide n=1 Tax=Lasioglossum baleicum TaxID=434251 RepID=UPI003FCE0B7C